MKTFGAYLFEFVEEVLKDYSSYDLKQLSVTVLDAGFDYCLGLEKESTIQDLGTKLMRDLESVPIPDSDTPISIIFLLKSKVSGGALSLRFCETLEPEGEDEEDFEEEESCEKEPCCRKSCRSKDESSEKMSKERDGAYRILIDLMEKMRAEDERKSSRKPRGFMAGFRDEYFF